MNSIILFNRKTHLSTYWWKLKKRIRGYREKSGNNLITEIDINRIFRIVENNIGIDKSNNRLRVLIQLYEDGYICWVNINDLVFEEFNIVAEDLYVRDEEYIQTQIPLILTWIKKQSIIPHKYLWGGTVGPDYDCSGLIQSAFLKHNIFLPRDSFQIKKFCKHLFNFPGNIQNLKMGDLLFFGIKGKCNHVAIYFKDGLYFHCSGKDSGRDGIALDSLIDKKDFISLKYFSELISAGRVTRSYKWNQTIR